MVTLVRNVQGYTRASPWYILEVTFIYCTNNMFTVSFFSGLCTSNMFMVFQVVILWLYMSYKSCVVVYLITKIAVKKTRVEADNFGFLD